MIGQMDCDVLVIGSGASGLTAALTAAIGGLKVLVVEKDSVVGGTTAYSAGVIWIPANRQAREAGLSDSRDAALDYIRSEAGNHINEAKARAFVDTAAPMLDFFESNTHAQFSLIPAWSDYHPQAPGAVKGGRSLLPDTFDGRALGDWFGKLRAPLATTMIFGGMMVGRDDIPHLFQMTRSRRSAWHSAKLFARYAADRLRYSRGTRLSNGNALVARLVRSALDRGVTLLPSSPVERLVIRDAAVAGAIIRRDGATVQVNAKHGVVLATGGFPASDAMRARFAEKVRPGKFFNTLAPPTNIGDGQHLATAAGGVVDDAVNHHAAWVPVSLVPQRSGPPIPFPHFIDRGKPGFIAVTRRGQRFVNEALSYHDFVGAMLEACHGEDQVEAFLICDHVAVRRFGMGVVPPAPGGLSRHLKSGYLKQGATLAALAEALGIDPAGLEASVNRFNAGAVRGADPEFNKGADAYQAFNGAEHTRGSNPCVAPIETGPFYGMKVIVGDLGTFAGIKTDAAARVLNADGDCVPGLFAVGNDMTSIMGGAYPAAGITIGPAMTFGFIAGRELLKRAGVPVPAIE